ncbi:uroporphyrinogen-III synthase [Halalkalibacter urbisdiaboli]|uniref:uroporphyrinogen-III synthase n=1 Tax=Halalkalibacter urbisdiaboli TaxID=1960589 RepID=UPI000B449D02|nr:uroporphyrinogen-III synthase [Halalkalibacter urbisdiaboli]
MGIGLTGKRVVIAGARKTEEMSTIIEKQGGIPVLRPLQGTVYLADKQIETEFKELIQTDFDWVLFTTGIGLETLLELAERLTLKERFIEVIQNANVASRGYKTVGVLKKIGVKSVAVDIDGTTQGLMHSLEKFDFSNKQVLVQLHGLTVPKLTDFLEQKGAKVTEILPYQHIAPEKETIELLCSEILSEEVDAICFTTAIQVRSLFDYAKEQGFENQLIERFSDKVVAVSVGKVTTEALKDEGVARVIAPVIERMGAMIVEAARFYSRNEN